MSAYLWPFLIYWLVFFVACYTVCEVGQDQFYDEVTPRVGLKVGLGTLIFAALATWFRPSFESMFTSDIAWTTLQAIVWFLVFTFLFQFHPWHALGISLVTLVLVSGLATLGVESLTKARTNTAASRRAAAGPSLPVRKSLGGAPAPEAKPAPAK